MIVHIAGDYGGPILPYMAQVERWRRDGTEVHIDGPCASACTLVLGLPPGQVCLGRSAALGFHAGASTWTAANLWAAYPPRIRDWLVVQNAKDPEKPLPGVALTRVVRWLSGAGLRQLLRTCGIIISAATGTI